MSKSLHWDDLAYTLQPWIRTAVEVMGFDMMTPVQASTIPLFACNKDVVVDSVTGSGKTAAFVIPILEKIIAEEANSPKLKKGNFHTLVLAPTRELASQIDVVIQSFLQHYPEDNHPIRSQLLVGTNDSTIRDDLALFLERKPQILVGTPGRLVEFLAIPTVKTSMCGMLVLDEADRLLDAGFIDETEKILRLLPKQRRTGLFSATITSAGDKIFRAGLRNPVKITVNSKSQTPSSLTMSYAIVDPEFKIQQLLNIISNYRFKKCIVYFPTCVSVSYFYSFISHLQETGAIDQDKKIFSLHGKLQTTSRMKTLETFTKTLQDAVLFTTDVAARGIDIPDVDLVVQLDPPTNVDMFLHRCGRSGRANRIGKALTLLNKGREEHFIPFMQVKNIELHETVLKPLNSSSDFYKVFRTWILQDRARFDHAVKAYVGFIRYYSNHSASSIFRLQSLDYLGLAKMYGLFRLPRMPEISRYFKPNDDASSPVYRDGWLVDPPVDMDKYAYRDKKREHSRVEQMKNVKAIEEKKKWKSKQKDKNAAWSNKKEGKELKAERRTKMGLKRKAIEEQLAKQAANKADETANDIEAEDWKEVILQNKKRKPSSSAVQGSFDDL